MSFVTVVLNEAMGTDTFAKRLKWLTENQGILRSALLLTWFSLDYCIDKKYNRSFLWDASIHQCLNINGVLT